MSDNHITLIGCGAQAKYAIEILARSDRTVSQVLDPIGFRVGGSLGGFPIGAFSEADFLKNFQKNNREKYHVIICLSNNKSKQEFFKKLKKIAEFINAIHPDCTISSNAGLGSGLIINAGAVIQPYAKVGHGCMIHAGVIVEHDNTLGNFVNLAPGVVLAGGVEIGDGTTIFSGTIVAPNVKIGKYAVIGAGSLVLQDIPDGVLAYGTPAKVIKELDE